jgi:hypothetical protein
MSPVAVPAGDQAALTATATTLDDASFLTTFEDCSFPADAFDHTQHVRLAWLYLGRLPPLAAIERFSAALRRFAAHHGAAGKYHETITWAFLLLIAERMEGEPSFEAFRAANLDLFARPSVLTRYYRPETLASERARRRFVLPDLGVEKPPGR